MNTATSLLHMSASDNGRQSQSRFAKRIKEGTRVMKSNICIAALTSIFLAGCVVEQPVPVTTTTTRTTEVVTTGPAVAPTREVIVTRPPPAVRVETQTVSPGTNYVWTRGYWRWTGAEYVWVPGSWVVRPRIGAVYVQGEWARRSSGWVYLPGHWQ